MKQEVKKSFRRFAFLAEVLAFVPFRLRSSGISGIELMVVRPEVTRYTDVLCNTVKVVVFGGS